MKENEDGVILKELTHKLLPVAIIAIGNILIIVGENLIERGKVKLEENNYM